MANFLFLHRLSLDTNMFSTYKTSHGRGLRSVFVTSTKKQFTKKEYFKFLGVKKRQIQLLCKTQILPGVEACQDKIKPASRHGSCTQCQRPPSSDSILLITSSTLRSESSTRGHFKPFGPMLWGVKTYQEGSCRRILGGVASRIVVILLLLYLLKSSLQRFLLLCC